VLDFGDAHSYGAINVDPRTRPVVAIASTPDGKGYWIVTRAGSVDNFGDAAFFGSPASSHRRGVRVVGFAAGNDGRGYDVVTSAGSVYNFGDAGFFGSTVHERLTGDVVAVALGAPTPPPGSGLPAG
jgi:hypothetical protein